MSNVHIINLAQYQAPVITESKKNEWVEYGEENGYYNWLIERYRKSPTNNAVINNIARLIFGRGLNAFDASRKVNQYAQLKSIFSDECLRKVSLDLKLFGSAHFQVHFDEKHTTVKKAYHIPTNLIRPEKCNEDGDIEGYYYSDNWEDVKKFEPKRYSAFGTSKDKIEILCVQGYSVGMKYFGELDYLGCLPYTVLEEEIADYLINEVQNGFSGTKVVNFNNGIPDEEKQEETKNKVLRKLSGSRGEKIIVAFNDNVESKTTVDDIPLNDAPEHYAYLSKECEQKILVGHNVVSPMLVGVVTDNQGFSSNADEIEVSSKYFYNIGIKPFQDLIISGIDKILAFNSVALDLYFKRLNLLEDIEEKAQQQEEQTQLSSHIEGLLSQFGEEESEEWELIDAREVDYKLEDDLNAQVSEWENSLKPKKTILSKLWELVGTGRANPNAPSNQDKEIDGFYFKVRYAYTGNPSPERAFCRAMMSANKVYKKEDIDRMSQSIVNAGFGENGADTYDIFLYKGGARCHHKWERRTYVSAKKNASIGSNSTSEVSTGKAEKFGYRVRNPKQVAMMPNDMPLKGFSPNNPNLPSDVI
jgi:hypothetical protein